MKKLLNIILLAAYTPGYIAALALGKADGMPTIKELKVLMNGGYIE